MDLFLVSAASLSLSAIALLVLVYNLSKGPSHIHRRLAQMAYNTKQEHLRDITRGKFLN